jgi:hypothetical protein
MRFGKKERKKERKKEKVKLRERADNTVVNAKM